MLEIRNLQARVGQKGVYIFPEVLAHQIWNSARKNNAKTSFGNCPAHHVFSLGIKDGTGGQYLWPWKFESARHYFRGRQVTLFSGHDYGGCTISKQTGGDQVRDR